MKNLIFVFVVACQSGNNFLYFVPQDKNTSTLIQDITKDVNASLGCQALSLNNEQVKVDDTHTIERRRVMVKRDKKENLGTDWGFFDIINNEISYSDHLDFETWTEGIKFILLHELGHAMGLEHTPDTVMNDNYKFMPYKESLSSLIDLLNKHNKNQCAMVKE